jgi:hypothetical protein
MINVDTTGLILIISTTVTGLVTIINAVSSGWGRDRVDRKLNSIHEQTNGNLSTISDKLDIALERIKILNEENVRLRSIKRGV